ncbi:small subunit ribosomal protein S17, partial [Phenoliferia sp. Uapishka_3]
MTLRLRLSRQLFSLNTPRLSSSLAPTQSAPKSTSPSVSPYILPNGHVMTGIVTQAGKMLQTTTVTVEHRKTHPKTLKEFKEHHKFLVHDPEQLTVVGDRVKIRNCRPVSKRKRFELVEILKGARERVENVEAAAAAEVAKEV